jgi:UPF0716 protein FxsA
MPFLLLALIAVPLIEVALFIQIGGVIGLLPTIGAIILTAVIGAALLRRQGLKAVADAQAAADRGEAPIRPVFDVFCLFFAGALLLTPGFLTDAVGFALLIPAVRAMIGYRLWEWARHRIHIHQAGGPGARGGPGRGRPGVIDVEYEEVDESDPRTAAAEAERRSREDAEADPDLPPPDRSRWGRRE